MNGWQPHAILVQRLSSRQFGSARPGLKFPENLALVKRLITLSNITVRTHGREVQN